MLTQIAKSKCGYYEAFKSIFYNPDKGVIETKLEILFNNRETDEYVEAETFILKETDKPKELAAAWFKNNIPK